MSQNLIPHVNKSILVKENIPHLKNFMEYLASEQISKPGQEAYYAICCQILFVLEKPIQKSTLGEILSSVTMYWDDIDNSNTYIAQYIGTTFYKFSIANNEREIDLSTYPFLPLADIDTFYESSYHIMWTRSELNQKRSG